MDWQAAGVTTEAFATLVSGIQSLLPIVIGVSIPLLVIRKGWSFLMGNIYSA